jgi:CRISPR system Cascade subunit CasC
MRIEMHVLQNFAPANLNRDDTGSPKDAEFGGYRRARISSQCWKRASRRYFQEHDLISPANRAIRTKRLLEHVRSRLMKRGRDESAVNRAVTTALAAGGLKLAEDNLTQYLLFLGEGEISRFTEIVDKHFDALARQVDAGPANGEGAKKKSARKEKAEAKSAAPEEVQKSVPTLLDGGKAADLALFGRMLADLPDKNVDAACQVSHALSTNQIHSMEMDYYTAVDDINNDNPGADMIGTVEFNSACFYRYANLDLDQLRTNLQNDEGLVRKTAEAFLEAFIHAIPTGKQNSFAAHNPPSLVFGLVRSGAPVSLANAFVNPVRPHANESLVDRSIAELDRYQAQVQKMYPKLYDNERLKKSAFCKLENGELSNLGEDAGSVDNLIRTIVAAAFNGQEGR